MNLPNKRPEALRIASPDDQDGGKMPVIVARPIARNRGRQRDNAATFASLVIAVWVAVAIFGAWVAISSGIYFYERHQAAKALEKMIDAAERLQQAELERAADRPVVRQLRDR